MEYKAFKRQMSQRDPANKYMADSDMRTQYEEYLSSSKDSQSEKVESEASNVESSSRISRHSRDVAITDIDMPFGSMVKFMLKWALASIPAFVILFVIFTAIFGMLGGLAL